MQLHNMVNFTLLANGDFPSAQVAISSLFQSQRVVCCDGAFLKYAQWWQQLDPKPESQVAVVGDGDSLTPEMLAHACPQGLHYKRFVNPDQETNDLTKAFEFVLSQARSQGLSEEQLSITFLGATGRREDHTLGNISLLHHYHAQHPHIQLRMVTDYGTFQAVSGSHSFKSFAGQQVSIFSATPQIPVTVSGLQYPIQDRCLFHWWEGTLNAALGNTFQVEGGELIVFTTHRVKSIDN